MHSMMYYYIIFLHRVPRGQGVVIDNDEGKEKGGLLNKKGYFLFIFQRAPGLKCLAVAVSVAAVVTVAVAIGLIGFRASIVTS